MKKKYVARDAESGDYFQSADWQGANFGKVDIRLFDSEEEAVKRIQQEAELFPDQFADSIIEILAVLVF